MQISGFTIIRNAVLNDYPVVEAITSILPVVDEMIVLVGNSEDGTEALIKSIASPKIKIHHSVWDDSLREGGKVLAVETDKAFNLIDSKSDWAFYIQADEAVHEKYHDEIKTKCLLYKDNKKVEGLLFKYLHFYGTYDYVGDSRSWYSHEVRIIKNDKHISAYKDAQGFRRAGKKLQVKLLDAFIYHYGWVKSPQQMLGKQKNVIKYWQGDSDELTKYLNSGELYNFNDYDAVEKFKETHPAVMQNRINKKNWSLQLDTHRKNFSLKDALLYRFEKLTGIRLFDFKNYKII